MLKLLTALITLLLKLASVIQGVAYAKEQANAQKETTSAEQDPAAWLDGHFNGDAGRVLDNPAVPRVAENADTPNAEKSETK